MTKPDSGAAVVVDRRGCLEDDGDDGDAVDSVIAADDNG